MMERSRRVRSRLTSRVSQPVDRRRHASIPRYAFRSPLAKPSVSTRHPAERSSTRPRRRRIDPGTRRRPRVWGRNSTRARRPASSRLRGEGSAGLSRTLSLGRGVDVRAIECPARGGLTPAGRRGFSRHPPRSGREVYARRTCRGVIMINKTSTRYALWKTADIVLSRVKTRSVASLLGVCRLGHRMEGRGCRA